VSRAAASPDAKASGTPASGGAWAEPGAYRVDDGVYRIPLPLPSDALRAVNVYVIETPAGLTCIDGGWAIGAARDQLGESMAQVGLHPRDITSFLVTHAHRDHYTQAVTLRSEFGRAVVSLGVGERPSLRKVQGRGEGFSIEQRLRIAGAPDVADAWSRHDGGDLDMDHWLDPDCWIDGDQDIQVGDRVLRAVETPGHTAGHLVFADHEAGLLFAGDHVLPTITPSIGFESAGRPAPLADFLASLAKVRAMPDLRLLPAHGDVHVRSHERVEELLAHHEGRLAQTQAAVAGGAATSREVAGELGWTRRERRLRDLDGLNQGLAIMETMAHLDVLASRGQVVREVSDGVARYRVA
jgi:glyoxylase-like metal-dependent hydrolase (beta-lactamase superfamily II)